MNRDTVKEFLNIRDISFDETKIDTLFMIMKSTLETNEKFNLTAIKDEPTFLEKMIVDSALPLIDSDFDNKSIIDIGTGAGFPGLVLYTLNPNMNLTLLDATKKKIDYLSDFTKANNMNIKCVNDRVESFAQNNRDTYDYAIARAVAPLNILLELVTPIIKVGGTFLVMKGPGLEEELKESTSALKKLNCHLVKIYEDELPESHEVRKITYIRKDKETNVKYPRDYASIKKKPL